MSIANEITRLQNAKADIKSSIENKGVTVPSSAKLDGYSDYIDAIQSGGVSAEKKQINFIDYDGTILHSYTKAEIEAMTAESELPANPSHDGLVAQGWNWTLAQIKSQLTSAPTGDVWVGQMYITESGDTEIDVEFPGSARLSPYLGFAVNGTATIDWGDGSAVDTVTGASETTQKFTQHTYSATGNYTIKIHLVSGTAAFYMSSNNHLLSKQTGSHNTNRVYSNCVQAVRLGNSFKIGSNGIAYCASVKYVTLPRSITSLGESSFRYCYSLVSMTIPSGVTSIGDSTIEYCSSLKSVAVPANVTNLGSRTFQNCGSIRSITIPSGVTSIKSYAVGSCYALASTIIIPSGATSIENNAFAYSYTFASLTIPSTVTSIGTNAFNSCSGVAEYHIKPTTPPTLANTNAFSGIPSDCIIYVPSASLNAYKTESNWSTYASYMQGE